ncbi:MAG TPA: phytoene desaturase [Microscillaceae bacterium]|nr:phytoene desaturase [Microscillaceae bacterium]
MKAVIVGAGIAGIATSIRLANLGYEVDVFEANDYPGGKLTQFEQEGFRFDAGPSLFTMPFLVDELFTISGKEPRHYFNYERLPIVCNYFYEDGTRLNAFADHQAFAQEIEKKLEVPAAQVEKHLHNSAEIFEHTHKLFMEQSLHQFKNFLNIDTLVSIVNMFKMHIFSTMHEVNERKLKNPHLVQLFNRYATYNGSSPYKAPGILNIIPHLEHNMGAYLPEGGMHSITLSLVKLAIELGVKFHYGQKVEKIIVQDKPKQAKGIRVQGQTLDYDLVISNMDVVPTYRHLLKSQKAPEKTLQQERSSSALIFYWGINAEFPELDVHNILFAKDYKSEFAHIFDLKKVYSDPTVYINITSKRTEGDAPTGGENWFVMVNVPGNQGQDWDAWIDETRENVIQKVSRVLGKNIRPLIATEAILDPRSIEQKTSSFQGSLYGSSSNNRYAAFLRHPNFSRKIKNLYFCGGSVHPGGGIPLCLLSAKIVGNIIKERQGTIKTEFSASKK